MNIYCAGSEHYINQIDRIRQGFLNIGHNLSNIEKADVIYCNDSSVYSNNYKEINKTAKLIYNVLDIPPHCIDSNLYDTSRYPNINFPIKNFDPLKLKYDLQQADVITCICNEVKWQLESWCNINNANVIYNPVKEVSFLNLTEEQKIKNKFQKRYKYLYVGRANDPNKRFNLVYDTMIKLNEKSSDLAVIGSENPGWGDYYGVVDDQTLNLFYNSVDYLFFPSAFKSQGLPALESIITKTIPIVLNDDPTTQEFWPNIGVEINNILKTLQSVEWNNKCKQFIEDNFLLYKTKFSKNQIAQNIISLC
jgi:hypothetical protein